MNLDDSKIESIRDVLSKECLRIWPCRIRTNSFQMLIASCPKIKRLEFREVLDGDWNMALVKCLLLEVLKVRFCGRKPEQLVRFIVLNPNIQRLNIDAMHLDSFKNTSISVNEMVVTFDKMRKSGGIFCIGLVFWGHRISFGTHWQRSSLCCNWNSESAVKKNTLLLTFQKIQWRQYLCVVHFYILSLHFLRFHKLILNFACQCAMTVCEIWHFSHLSRND